METIFKNANVNGKLVDIKTSNGKIIKVGKINEDGVDLKGDKVYPGLFDIHLHGCVLCDTMDGDKLHKMSEFLVKKGTTSYLPTTMTAPYDEIKKVVDISFSNDKGANVVGFHLEGPYINKKYKGAQNEDFIISPDLEKFKELKNIKLITLAPELSGANEFIKNCGCLVSMGHTDATYKEADEAIKNGAVCVTHTFNAMSGLHHREPGAIGAAIDNNIFVQVISDGVHLHESIVRMLYRLFGADRIILISDSMCATGVSDGEYVFGGQKVVVKDSVAKTLDGAIAGSTTTLFDCVKKAIEFGIPEQDAFKMASMLGEKKGKIEEGYDAEFIVLDQNLNLKMTVVRGQIV